MRRELPKGRGGLVALATAGALLLAGCGIPSGRAQPISSRNLPPELSGTTSSPTTTSTTVPPATQHDAHLEIYLVDSSDGHLAAVRRYWDQHLTPLDALGLLATGPNSTDSKHGLTTSIGAAAKFGVTIRKHGIAAVSLDTASFGDLFGIDLYVPLAQIVYTLMANFNLKGVDFYLGGELYNYTPSGSTSPAPVTERTYSSLAPLPVH